MKIVKIKISEEMAAEFKSELKVAGKNIESLKGYADLFAEREFTSDYFEEKMIRKVENVKHILDWIIKSSKKIIDQQIKQVEMKGANNG